MVMGMSTTVNLQQYIIHYFFHISLHEKVCHKKYHIKHLLELVFIPECPQQFVSSTVTKCTNAIGASSNNRPMPWTAYTLQMEAPTSPEKPVQTFSDQYAVTSERLFTNTVGKTSNSQTNITPKVISGSYKYYLLQYLQHTWHLGKWWSCKLDIESLQNSLTHSFYLHNMFNVVVT